MSWSFSWQGKRDAVAKKVSESSTQYLPDPEKAQVEQLKSVIVSNLMLYPENKVVAVEASGSATVQRSVEEAQQNIPGKMVDFNFSIKVTGVWNHTE